MSEVSTFNENDENKLFLRSSFKQLDGFESPRTLSEVPMVRNSPRRLSERLSSPRSSPRRTPNSPKISSRLPIRSAQNAITRFSIKDLHLPPDDSITNTQNNNLIKVTPEKLMEELREEVKKNRQARKLKEVDDEISLSIPFTGLGELKLSDPIKPRMSLRNRCPVIVDAPDLVYEDPLEVARQTLQNTRANTGYRHIKLIYTTERRKRTRSNSPEPAFSKKKGVKRHLLKMSEEAEIFEGKLLKFDRVLKLFEDEEDAEEVEDFNVNLDAKPSKSCLKPHSNLHGQAETADLSQNKAKIVQIKRICYDGDDEEATSNKSIDPPDSPTKKRRLSNGNAKRLKKPED